jgi:hypothetical protein
MVEPQFSKLITWVRFPSPAPLNQCFNFCVTAHVAQSVEHFLGKEEVEGSIPFVSTSVIQFVRELALKFHICLRDKHVKR